MLALVIMVLWTWGLTPLWVNIVGTVLIGLKILWTIGCSIITIVSKE